MPLTPEIFGLRYSQAFVATASRTKLERRECSNSSGSPSTASTLSRSPAKVRTRIKTSKSPVELLDAEEINNKVSEYCFMIMDMFALQTSAQERNSYIAFPPTWVSLGRDSRAKRECLVILRVIELPVRDLTASTVATSKIIDRMQNEERLLHSQVWRFPDQLSQAKGEAGNLKTQVTTLEEQARSMSLQGQVASINMNDLKGACNQKDQELSERSHNSSSQRA
ncbi:hypothetical protein MBM_04299 [Drepanopeziza brunnea f. sp. 'multigermtubi' MB_m1]|uniref:Uncharacterized protein n=1 Tax=Marssonina brunnea f. sp. multigermtubi (strain MB_m1) TaxID=1072389 RepID=K1X9M4_MARBU|nr:uncharacterized protein MBM_04299 [Drepanopeziza brunnea f. sp. 'multigermtubi' MB_m1]EKD17438.1 hypothetical protein MBM_04299 [Drepanopeziza brunnea f. sp. 'multigermtubi' MB_m1]